MKCPKCKQEMRTTGINYDDAAIDLRTGETSQPYENHFYHCDSCNNSYVSYAGSRIRILRAPKKTKEQIELEAKKEAQKAKMREYHRQRNEEKAAQKAKEREELMAYINRDTPEIKSIVMPGPKLTLEKKAKKEAPKKAAGKKGLTDEEKKERAREYHRKRYAAMKAKKKN